MARTTVTKTAARNSETKFFIVLNELEVSDNDVDDFDPKEGNDHPAQAINEQVALENRQRPDRFVNHASERQWDQGDNDQCVENHRTENGASRRLKMHDV